VHSGGECRQHTFVFSLKVYGFCYTAIAFLRHGFDLLKSQAVVEKMRARLAHVSYDLTLQHLKSEEYRRVGSLYTDVSEERVASVLRVEEITRVKQIIGR
jgi:hypothetical protein